MSWLKKKRIFLDFAGGKDNPSGIHKEGMEARKKLEDARLKIAQILGAQKRDIIFTSGGTESDNLAILGAFEATKGKIKNPHIIISDGEHPAVLESAKEAERRGAELSIVPVDKIIENIKDNTILVSVIYGNNETGAINPVPKLARLIKDLRRKKESKYPYFHTDASAAYEYLEININKIPADLLTLGEVLVVRPNVELRPLIMGGGQERGLRSGTENISSIIRFANELELIELKRVKEVDRLTKLKEIFLTKLKEGTPQIVVNTPNESLPNIVNITIPGILHEFLAIKLDERGVAVSTGSSCDSNKSEVDKETLRFSFGKNTRIKDVSDAVRILKEEML